MDSPNSELSEYASDDFSEEVKHGRRHSYEETPDHEPSGRPHKRPRLTRAISDPPALHQDDEEGAISEDTDGSVPASPHHGHGMSNEDEYAQDQVTECKWDGCNAGDLGNMDKLVDHLHEDHIGVRQKKYSCEWSDCNRKGIPHASGYALRAHMRSHTREKPFYCTLPECDRSFTRSDALAKHMRTVHETEALRPSDPVPKHHSSNPSHKFQRLRLVLHNTTQDNQNKTVSPSNPASPSGTAPNSATTVIPPPSVAELEYAHHNVIYLQDLASPNAPALVQFPPDMNFTDHELSLPAQELFRLLRRQLHWATQENEELKHEAEELEKKRKEEWVEKELLLENVMEAELARTRRQHVEQGTLEEPDSIGLLEGDVQPARALEIRELGGKKPWWREEAWMKPMGDIREGNEEKEMPVPELKAVPAVQDAP
ncbi:hypothetical protein GQ43DRAFT_443458 [Delitschia confertaspora ATCC 74209]|uniref:C2H2-type domain-containing protein n=1 Tax=Delitschia confertaspora ATCC 74209 TaxID=1513339 RepID=A0A9P4JF95_9PLEO|nr:hypothetical protein GQ43DRAFT_443458 [Delitschia confertaspora ATCC 74209]